MSLRSLGSKVQHRNGHLTPEIQVREGGGKPPPSPPPSPPPPEKRSNTLMGVGSSKNIFNMEGCGSFYEGNAIPAETSGDPVQGVAGEKAPGTLVAAHGNPTPGVVGAPASGALAATPVASSTPRAPAPGTVEATTANNTDTIYNLSPIDKPHTVEVGIGKGKGKMFPKSGTSRSLNPGTSRSNPGTS